MSRCVFTVGLLSLGLLFTACGPEPTIERVTVEPTQVGRGAPIYTETPTFTPSATPTATHTFTATATATATFTPTATATATATLTPTITPTSPPSATPPLATLTLVPLLAPETMPQATVADAALNESGGWSCGDFPCAGDVEGFLRRLQVPSGFRVDFVGRFPGQVNQIALDEQGRLYATVLTDAAHMGAVYRLDETGTAVRVSPPLLSPYGLAFQPGTDVLYVSGRTTPTRGGSLWRLLSNGTLETVRDDLPCCHLPLVGSQPNGLMFGADGFLYLGVGALTDYSEAPEGSPDEFTVIQPEEAAVLRIQPHTGETSVYATGLHNPMDLTVNASGLLYGTDSGLLQGMGDRVVAVQAKGFYGWPYYRTRGCQACPISAVAAQNAVPDLLTLPDYSLPRGLTVYTGTQFPAALYDRLFVTLWNETEGGQRVLWLDPRRVGDEGYTPGVFMTGLIRPSDVIVAADGSLLVADYVYGHVWRVSYGTATSLTINPATALPTPDTNASPVPASGFATNTPEGS